MRIKVSTLKRAGVARILDGLGIEVVSDHGHEVSAACPYCDKRDHFWISTKHGGWICFRCDERGGIVRLTADVLDLDWDAAVRWLRDKAGFKVTRRSADEIRRHIARLVDEAEKKREDLRATVPRTAVPIVKSVAALRWLGRRSISEAVARDRDLRWCDSGRWGGRVLVPIVDLDGKPLTFIARRIDDVDEKRYLHPTGPEKSRTLYAFPEGREAVVVEGVMDALRWLSEGVPATAIMGSSMSAAQAIALKRLDEVTLCFDADEAGRYGQEKAVERLRGQVAELRTVNLPEGKDPGDTEAAGVLPGRLVGSDVARRLRRRLRGIRTETTLLGDERDGR